MRILAVWGTITGLLRSDARVSDLGSILRDVTASTKRLSSHSKAAGPRNQRLCLVPHTCRFLGTAIVGLSNGGEVLVMRVLHLRPHPSAQEKGGRPVRPRKNSAREMVFLRPRSAYRAFPCGKRKAPTPPPMCRGQGGALLFSADAVGGRRRHVR